MKTRTKSLKIKVKIKGNYEEKLSQEIISYYISSRENVGIIGKLAYPENKVVI